jgi:hypothetical protein
MKVEEENIQMEKEDEEVDVDIPKEEELCRICFIQTEKPLFHPCKCNGTMKFVHETCLMNWINVKKSNTCDICHHEFAFSSGKLFLFLFFRVLTRNSSSFVHFSIFWWNFQYTFQFS